jgi:hypothetical protein
MQPHPEKRYFFDITILEPTGGAELDEPVIVARGTFKAYYWWSNNPQERLAQDIDTVEASIDGSPVRVEWDQAGQGGKWDFQARVVASGWVTIEVKLLTGVAVPSQITKTCDVRIPAAAFDYAGWTRIEPRCRADDFAAGLEARTADPLWFLTRQWQTGEFLSEDTGSPLRAQLTYSTQALEWIRLGASGQVRPLLTAPLEMVAEEQRPNLDWRTRVQAGQQFERLIRSVLASADQNWWRQC